MDPSSEFSYDITDLSTVTSYDAGILQAQAYRTLRRLADESLQGTGLSSMQWFMVGAVRDNGPSGIGISDLSTLLGTNVPFVTNSVNELIARGVLMKTQSGTDARARLITVHPDFLPQVAVIEDKVRNNLRRSVYARITPRELALYVTVLRKLNSAS